MSDMPSKDWIIEVLKETQEFLRVHGEHQKANFIDFVMPREGDDNEPKTNFDRIQTSQEVAVSLLKPLISQMIRGETTLTLEDWLNQESGSPRTL